jgi:hypothetical protein
MLRNKKKTIPEKGSLEISVSQNLGSEIFTIKKIKGGDFSSFDFNVALLYLLRKFFYKLYILIFLFLPVTAVVLWLSIAHSVLYFFLYFLFMMLFISFLSYKLWGGKEKTLALKLLKAYWYKKKIIYEINGKEMNQQQLQKYFSEGTSSSVILIKIPQ